MLKIHGHAGDVAEMLQQELALVEVQEGASREALSRAAMEVLLLVPARSRIPTSKVVTATEDGFAQTGWCDPYGVSTTQNPVFDGAEALLLHHYLERHEEGMLSALAEYPDRRAWICARLLADRSIALEAGGASNNWALIKSGGEGESDGDLEEKAKAKALTPLNGHAMPLGVWALRRMITPITSREGVEVLTKTVRARGGTVALPGVREAWKAFEPLAQIGDILPSAFLAGKGQAAETPLRSMKAGVLLGLLRAFLGSLEATADLADPRLEPLKDWVWQGPGPMPLAQLKRVVGWQSGAIRAEKQNGTCAGCGFPVWEHLDRARGDSGWGLAEGMGNAWRTSDIKSARGDGPRNAKKGEMRTSCLLCRTAKYLIDQGSVRRIGERGVWLKNHGEQPIPKDRIWHYREASKTLVLTGGKGPVERFESLPDLIQPGQSVCIGGEGEALAPLGMPDNRRRQMGRWGFVYQGLARDGFTVAIGLRNHLDAPMLFGSRSPTNERAYAQEMARALAAGIFGLSVYKGAGEALRADYKRTPGEARLSSVYGAAPESTYDTLMAAMNGLREGGVIAKDIAPGMSLRVMLTNLYRYLIHEGASMTPKVIRLAEEIEFWSGPALKVFAHPAKRYNNKGEATIAFREAFSAALRIAPARGETEADVRESQVQAAKVALVKRVRVDIPRDDNDVTHAIIQEACIRIERLLEAPINLRQGFVNAIAQGVRQSVAYRLDWAAIREKASEDTLAAAVAGRNAAMAAKAERTRAAVTVEPTKA